MSTDEWTGMTKATGTFRDYVKTPKTNAVISATAICIRKLQLYPIIRVLVTVRGYSNVTTSNNMYAVKTKISKNTKTIIIIIIMIIMTDLIGPGGRRL